LAIHSFQLILVAYTSVKYIFSVGIRNNWLYKANSDERLVKDYFPPIS